MPTTRTLAEVLADFADSPPKNVLAAELRDFAFSVAFLTDLLAHRNDAAPHPAYDPGVTSRRTSLAAIPTRSTRRRARGT